MYVYTVSRIMIQIDMNESNKKMTHMFNLNGI